MEDLKEKLMHLIVRYGEMIDKCRDHASIPRRKPEEVESTLERKRTLEKKRTFARSLLDVLADLDNI